MGTGSHASDDLRPLVVRELALVERPAPAANGLWQGGGIAASAADCSPSRDRLVRIAAMIRDAELAAPVQGLRERRRRDARLVSLIARRPASRSLSRAPSAA